MLIALTVNSAYSYIINTLKVEGKATIPKPETVNLCDGNLTYSINSWPNGQNSYFYVIRFTLEKMPIALAFFSKKQREILRTTFFVEKDVVIKKVIKV